MDLNFSGRTVLITGAGSGIGRATALAFARAGAGVVVGDRDEAGGQQTVAQIAGLAGLRCEAKFIRADVTDPRQVDHLVERAVNAHSHYTKLDIAINNAGTEDQARRTHQISNEDWQRVLQVNLSGVFYSMRAELKQMIRQGSGAIVNVSSVAGLVGFPWHAAYTASKHGIIGLTRSAALEYVRKGIRINAVCPGFTDTPMVARSFQESPEVSQRLLSGIPARRLGSPSEIAAAILYLCSDQAGFVTGHTLTIDGGITAG